MTGPNRLLLATDTNASVATGRHRHVLSPDPNTLAFEGSLVEKPDVSKGIPLPGCGMRYNPGNLKELLNEYANISTGQM